MDSPPPAVVAGVEQELRLVEGWYTATGNEFWETGRALTAEEARVALRLGVAYPEKVRVVVATQFPSPHEPSLLLIASQYGFGANSAHGRTHQYTIFIKPRYANESWLLRHELVHVGQIERMGVEGFLRRYLTELKLVGYSHSPLEWEANTKAGAVEAQKP